MEVFCGGDGWCLGAHRVQILLTTNAMISAAHYRMDFKIDTIYTMYIIQLRPSVSEDLVMIWQVGWQAIVLTNCRVVHESGEFELPRHF